MNETNNSRGLAVKLLVIIGFIATIFALLWLGTLAIQALSPAFSNLASVAEIKENYKPNDELTIATEKSVINSGESFQISWTDMKQGGEFKFTYVCENGVTMLVRGEDGTLIPMQCTETLSLPPTVHGLFLSVDSRAKRFADVEFSLAFVSSQKEITHVADSKITVVNPAVPAGPEVAGDSTDTDDTPAPPVTKPATTPAPAPVYTSAYPESNPNGYTDLTVKVIGTGELRNGVFAFTGSLDPDERNAIKFDVQNKGTRTSDAWNFEITLPDGTSHKSATQVALKPSEHAVIVLEFSVEEDDEEFGKITIETHTNRDSNSGNDDAVWYVKIAD